MVYLLNFVVINPFRFFLRLIKPLSAKDKQLVVAIQNITGYSPRNLHLFKLALLHSSVARENADGFKESNERLEYLGDAILGAVVADYLFRRFPYKNEGFMTEVRSRLVSRESLDKLCRKIGLDKLIEYDTKRKTASSFKSIYGDAMEAFVGAIYMDRGFEFCQDFIIKEILHNHIDLDAVIETDSNYKSRLIEWSQKYNKLVRFEILEDKVGGSHNKQFKVQVMIDDKMISQGAGYSKKHAEQDAARRACEALEVD